MSRNCSNVIVTGTFGYKINVNTTNLTFIWKIQGTYSVYNWSYSFTSLLWHIIMQNASYSIKWGRPSSVCTCTGGHPVHVMLSASSLSRLALNYCPCLWLSDVTMRRVPARIQRGMMHLWSEVTKVCTWAREGLFNAKPPLSYKNA